MKNNLKLKLKEQQTNKRANRFIHKITIMIIAFITSTTYAQDNEKVSEISGNNELKINGIYLVAGAAEITYERILSNETAFGVSVAFDVESDNFYNFGAFPYYRFYFGKKRAGGFFVEGNGAILVDEFGKEASLTINGNNGSLSISDSGDVTTKFGLGIGIGGKFLSRKGWIGELSMGFGRTFGVEDDAFKTYGRFGITIGKRF
ncbi:DUF3575 domain-containing protein [Tenacibaculum sp. MEBiC06402]|uniref:DUF3575 domain-containing protein n=1 Tax=unclassified Tenacibaculum TaxID=2635139 RepID=UPI003B9A2B6A